MARADAKELISYFNGMIDLQRHLGLMVRRCFPVAKIVGSSPIGVDTSGLNGS